MRSAFAGRTLFASAAGYGAMAPPAPSSDTIAEVGIELPRRCAQSAPRPVRQEPREIVELRTLRGAHPELADAVDMQIELVTHQRRLQARIPTPVVTLPRPVATHRLEQGERLVDFEAIPLDWSAAGQAVRATADILRRHNSLDGDDHAIITALVRDANSFERLLRQWYAETGAAPARPGDSAAHRAEYPAILDQVCALALRPFLARSVEAMSQGADLAAVDAAVLPDVRRGAGIRRDARRRRRGC